MYFVCCGAYMLNRVNNTWHYYIYTILCFHFFHLNIPFSCDDFRFLEDLDEGVFIQQTLESVLLNEDGKQIMVMTDK